MEQINKPKLQGVFIRLTEEQHQKLKEKSWEDDVPIASLVRSAVKKFLQVGDSAV